MSSSAALLTLAGLAQPPPPHASAGAVLSISGTGWGLNEDLFFSGNQPVYTNQPDPVKVDPTQPSSKNWPGPNVVSPTNVNSPTEPAFVGNQPVEEQPPAVVQINDVEPGSANWPAPVWIEEPPPENPG
jgi:hypothetical protein